MRLLQELKKKDRFLQLGLLVEDGESMAPHLGRLGFLPDAYNPEFEYVNQDLVNDIHRRGMQIFTWTVNDVPTMQTLLAMGVDGIISDYPDRLMTFGDR